tara:strand:+ start:608 stop:1492 length:885 start_codon:yes stop_codon:yes gene_type:complete
MKLDEVILIDSIPKNIYEQILMESLEYAILSIPFTINRMGIDFIEKRVENIIKGKLAEGIFDFFCHSNNINIDFKSCETPFWTIDKKDFIYQNLEWDIKNNYLHLDPKKEIDITYLPALVPNRHRNDQWSRRTAYVFSFIKEDDLVAGRRQNRFLKLDFSDEQIIFLDKVYRKYNGLPIEKEPFEPKKYTSHFMSLSDQLPYEISFHPQMYITAIATSGDWETFLDTGKGSPDHYRDFQKPEWYTRNFRGNISFMGGTIWGTITNKTAPISMLQSFSSYIDKDEFQYARLINGS